MLQATSSAKIVAHPDADQLLIDVSEVLRTRFWEKVHGAVAEEFSRDWRPISRYRGQNSNMHLAEACMAAFATIGDGIGLKVGAGVHKRRSVDPDQDRLPEPGEGQSLRDLFASPLSRIGEYRVSHVATCAYAFTSDHRFFGDLLGRTLVVSACSGHGYKFGAAVGRRIADQVENGDIEGLRRWLRAGA